MIYNSYNIGDVSSDSAALGGITGYTYSGATILGCYYLKNKQNILGVAGTGQDDTSKVTAINNISEITAAMLNANIDSIEHEEEWARWVDGPNGYPIFK